jgi:hypothetical protein
LAVTARPDSAAGSLPLYLHNSPPTTAALRMFVAGPPGYPGNIPIDAAINLHAEWGAQGVIPLVLNPGMVDDSLPMAIAGRAHAEDDVDLFIEGDGGVIYDSLDLALPDVFEPIAVDDHLDIAVPATHDAGSASCPTVVNGWRP